MANKNEDIQKGLECLERVESFILKHHITCEEAIFQLDELAEDSPYLVKDLCDIVGYLEDEEDEW